MYGKAALKRARPSRNQANALVFRIKAEVLKFTSLTDPIGPPGTPFAAFNKLTAKKDVDFGHEGNRPGVWVPVSVGIGRKAYSALSDAMSIEKRYSCHP